MKSSRRLLLIVSGTIVVLFVVALVFLKSEAKRVVKEYSRQTGLSRVEVAPFHSVVIGPGFDVSVIGWFNSAVSVDTKSGIETKMENIDGTLYFTLEEGRANVNEKVNLNIRVEDIQSIKSDSESDLELLAVGADTLSVFIGDSKSLFMDGCSIKYLEITTGDGLTITSTQIEE